MLNIVWFRRDLRVTDHQPLLNAVESGLVAPLVIVEPEYWQQSFASGRQWRFASRAIMSLRSQLAVIGAPLIVRTGTAIDAIQTLQEKSRDVVVWSHAGCASQWEADRDAEVQSWLDEAGIPWKTIPSIGDGYAPDGEAADWHDVLASDPEPAPDIMIAHGVTPGRIVSERILYLDDDPCEDLPGGAAAARRAIDLHAAEHSQASETEDTVRVETTLAAMEPHLAWGTLSVREAWIALEAVKLESKNTNATQRMQEELLKRFGPISEPHADTLSSDQIVSLTAMREASADRPEILEALVQLDEQGIARRDVIGRLVAGLSARLGVSSERILASLAPLCTGFVPDRHTIGSGFFDLEADGADQAPVA
ncbi:MAG: deoxyribodipyrimidine photo-lyase [Pseudomonadota bacterium]